MVKKGKKMSVSNEAFNYGASAAPAVGKKKRRIKLSRKQLKRKEKNIERGEADVDRRSKKALRDQRRLDQRLAAKTMW